MPNELKFDIKVTESAHQLFDWIDSHPVSVQVNDGQVALASKAVAEDSVHWSFENKAYIKERGRIERAFKERGLSNKKLPVFTLTWLAHYHRFYIEEMYQVQGHDAVFQKLLVWVVETYNKYGQEFTAYRFRFSPQHDFNWLPKTGAVEELGFAYHPKLKKVLPVRPEHKEALKEYLIRRQLRQVPEGLIPIVLRSPPRAKNQVKS